MPLWIWTVPSQSIEYADRLDKAISLAIQNNEGLWQNSSEPIVLTRSRVQKLIDQKMVLINDMPPKNHLKLKPGDKVKIHIPPPQALELTPEDIPFDILYEDQHLLVINKPVGLTVHPSETQKTGTLVHALLHHIKDLSGIGGVLRPGIVHRLDKDTSGALVISKSDEAHVKLVETFYKHDIQRTYWALCYGAPQNQKEKKIETLIGRNPKDRKKMTTQVKQGKKAITYYKCLESYGFASLIEARLETGRTHQVRVHLTAEGFSLLGDPIYGTPTKNQTKWTALPNSVQDLVKKLAGQALHARTIGFVHPITQKNLLIEAPLPKDFSHLLTELRKHHE